MKTDNRAQTTSFTPLKAEEIKPKKTIYRGSKSAFSLLSRKGVREIQDTRINPSLERGELFTFLANGKDGENCIRTVINLLEVCYRNSRDIANELNPNLKEHEIDLKGISESGLKNLNPFSTKDLNGKEWTPILLEISTHCKEVYGNTDGKTKKTAKGILDYLSKPNFDVCADERYTVKSSLIFISHEITNNKTKAKALVIYLNPILTQNNISQFVRWRGDFLESMRGRRTLMDWKLLELLLIGFSERTLHPTKMTFEKLWERIAVSTSYKKNPDRLWYDFERAVEIAKNKVGILDKDNPYTVSEDKTIITFNFNGNYLEG